MDESPLQPKPLSSQVRTNYLPEQATAETIREVGMLLSHFVWSYQLLHFETLVMAFIDRDDDPNMYLLLEYLFITDNQFSSRVEFFLSLNVAKEFWKEDSFFAKHKDFDQKYPEYLKERE